MFIKIFTYFIFSNWDRFFSKDTTNVEESSREMYTSVDVSFSNDKGNTNYKSLYYGFDFRYLEMLVF